MNHRWFFNINVFENKTFFFQYPSNINTHDVDKMSPPPLPLNEIISSELQNHGHLRMDFFTHQIS